MALPARRQSTGPHAGREHERNAAPGKDVGHRIDLLAAQVDVENGDIDVLLGLRQLGGTLDVAGGPHHLATEIHEHVLEQEAYQRIVLDHDDAQSLEIFGFRHIDPVRGDNAAICDPRLPG